MKHNVENWTWFFSERKEKKSDLIWVFIFILISGLCLVSLQSLCTAQNVNCRDLEGRHSTPLHFASGYNRVSVVEYLLHHGADVHAKDKGWDWFLGLVIQTKSSKGEIRSACFIFPFTAVWFLFITPVRTVTTRWPSSWLDTGPPSTWPTCGSSRRFMKLPQRGNTRSASCYWRFDFGDPFPTPNFQIIKCRFVTLGELL